MEKRCCIGRRSQEGGEKLKKSERLRAAEPEGSLATSSLKRGEKVGACLCREDSRPSIAEWGKDMKAGKSREGRRKDDGGTTKRTVEREGRPSFALLL